MRTYVMCLSILSMVNVFSMDSNGRFERIVDDNLGNPRNIVEQLKAWQEEGEESFPKIAQEFLEIFGGENFEPIEDSSKKHFENNKESVDELKNVALRIGSHLRKLGGQEIDIKSSLDNLRAAKTFLEFYYGKKEETKGNSRHDFFFDNTPDISPSLALDQLDDMIAAEEECIEAEKRLKEELSGAELNHDSNVDIGSLSDEDSSK